MRERRVNKWEWSWTILLYIFLLFQKYIYNNILLVLDMSPSPLLRTARWVALGAGYLYGQKRLAELRPIRAAEREKEEGKLTYSWIRLRKWYFSYCQRLHGRRNRSIPSCYGRICQGLIPFRYRQGINSRVPPVFIEELFITVQAHNN